MNKVFLLVLIVTCSISALADEIKMEYSLDYSCWGNYYPDQKGKEISWIDMMDLNAGIISQNSYIDSLWLIINCYNDQYDQSVRLEKTGFCLKTANWQYGYEYNRSAGIGKYSHIYPNILNSKYNRLPYVLPYNSSNIFISRSANISSWKFMLGGNDYNSLCSSINWQIKYSNYLHDLQLRVMGRDNYYHKDMISLNYEGYVKLNWLWISAASSSQLLAHHDDLMNVTYHNISFIESVISFSNALEAGANLRCRYLEEKQKELQFSSYLGIKFLKHDLNFIFSQEEWEIDNLMQSLNIIYWFQFNNRLKASLLASKFYPQYGNDCYQMGLQVSYKK